MYIYRKSFLGHRRILWFCFRERRNESRASMLKSVKYEHMSLHPRIPKWRVFLHPSVCIFYSRSKFGLSFCKALLAFMDFAWWSSYILTGT